MTGAEFIQRLEHLWKQPGHQLQDVFLHVIHFRPAAKSDVVILDLVLRELREGLLHLRAVVVLAFVPGDLYPVSLDVDAVPDLVQEPLHRGDVSHQAGERRGARVFGEVLPEREKAARAESGHGERVSQGDHGLAIDAGRVEEPAVPSDTCGGAWPPGPGACASRACDPRTPPPPRDTALSSRSRWTSWRYSTARTSRSGARKNGIRSYSSRPAATAAKTWSRFRSLNIDGSSCSPRSGDGRTGCCRTALQDSWPPPPARSAAEAISHGGG